MEQDLGGPSALNSVWVIKAGQKWQGSVVEHDNAYQDVEAASNLLWTMSHTQTVCIMPHLLDPAAEEEVSRAGAGGGEQRGGQVGAEGCNSNAATCMCVSHTVRRWRQEPQTHAEAVEAARAAAPAGQRGAAGAQNEQERCRARADTCLCPRHVMWRWRREGSIRTPHFGDAGDDSDAVSAGEEPACGDLTPEDDDNLSEEAAAEFERGPNFANGTYYSEGGSGDDSPNY